MKYIATTKITQMTNHICILDEYMLWPILRIPELFTKCLQNIQVPHNDFIVKYIHQH